MNELFSQGGKGSTGILTNKQAIARHFGVKQSEVLYFSVGAVLDGYKVIYDKSTQRSYSLPAGIPSGTTAISLSTDAVLVHSAGSEDLGTLAATRKEFVTKQENFNTGFTISTHNEQVVTADGVYYWAGSLPKVVPPGSSIEETGGVNATAWVNSYSNTVLCIKDLLTQPQRGTVSVVGYISGTDFGGGDFYWDAARPRSKHNGITVFSPTVPFSGLYADIPNFHAKVGETAPDANGCWVRKDCGRKVLMSWGGVDISGTQPMDAVVTSMCTYVHNTRQILDADENAVLKAGFTTGTQTKDKHNVFTQASVILEGKFVTIRGNGAKIDTYHPVHRERSVFVLRNGGYNISGFKWNDGYTDFSTSPADTQHKQGEWWMGIVADGAVTLVADHHEVTAAQVFVRADAFNATDWNERVTVRHSKFDYITNYCFLSRKLKHYEFSYNEVKHNGREWHTYGEACAPTTYTTHTIVRSNNFFNQIAEQSCITPGSYHKSCLIVNNHCERYRGIFVEIGSSSNISILNNYSYSSGERDSSHILLVSGGVDDEPEGGLNNLLINGNVFENGPYTLREYNTGTPVRRGITFSNNRIIDCPMPNMGNAAYHSMAFTNNYCQPPADFPYLVWAGKNPIIEGNTFVGGIIRARDLGYTITNPIIRNNVFRDGSTVQTFPALIDMTDFTRLVAEGNDVTNATFTRVIVDPANCTSVGFKRIGQAEGFESNPATLYGAKLTDVINGDIVMNNNPGNAEGGYAWVCVNSGSKQFGKIVVAV